MSVELKGSGHKPLPPIARVMIGGKAGKLNGGDSSGRSGLPRLALRLKAFTLFEDFCSEDIEFRQCRL
jgi:hypothetical protein